jgi:hypothetical protein
LGRTYVAALALPCATWRDTLPLGTITARSHRAARVRAQARWPYVRLTAGQLRVCAAGGVPTQVLALALALDGAVLLAD